MKPVLAKPKKQGLPFLRYSKFCFLQWCFSVYLLLSQKYYKLGFTLWLAFPILNEVLLNIIGHFFQTSIRPKEVMQKFESIAKQDGVFPIVYSPGYDITALGFEKFHPFDSTKYGRIWDYLF